MKSNKLYFLNKDIISLIVTLFFSLSLFFSNESIYVKKIEEKIIESISFIVYPKSWYENILVIEFENDLLKQKIVQLKLLNAKLDNYRKENIKLKEMLQFKELYPKLSLKPANKVNPQTKPAINSFTVIDSILLNAKIDPIRNAKPNLKKENIYGPASCNASLTITKVTPQIIVVIIIPNCAKNFCCFMIFGPHKLLLHQKYNP